MLEVSNLRVSYGPIEAVAGISLSIREGQIVAILGANGAGKSSLLNCVAGLIRCVAGSVSFEGRRIDRLPAHEVVHLGISLVPEGRRLFPAMTVHQHLLLAAHASGRGKADAIDSVFDLFPLLRERLNQRAGTLSGGEQQMVAVGRALVTRPRLLLLDEPSMGLAPFLVRNLFSKLKEIRVMGTTLGIVEQNVQEAMRVADHAYVMSNGIVAAEGPAEEVAARHHLAGLYLGEA